MMRKMVTGTIVAVIAAVTILVASTAAQAGPYCGISPGAQRVRTVPAWRSPGLDR